MKTIKRWHLGSILRNAFLIFTVAATLPFLTRAENTKPKYNVLFIGIDDLRVQISSYGFPQMKTPNFDRLAAMSLQFNRAYVQQAVCAASRASFLTGCRPDTTGVNYPYTPWFRDVFIKDHPEIGTWFKNQDYYSRHLGKIHHGASPNLTEIHFKPAPGGVKGRLYALPENIHEGPKPEWKGKVFPWESAEVADTEYEDGLVAEETIATMKRARESGKPFFIAPGFVKPHLPFCAPKKYWDLYNEDDLKLAEVDKLNAGQPEFTVAHHGLKGWGGMDDPENIPPDTARQLIHGYYACVSYIDAQIGNLLDALEELDLLDSTIVILWSDHGYHLGDQGMWGKSTNYEWATRVPLYLYVPGMSSYGKQSEALVEYVDLFPTLMELCGYKVPDYMEGTSFAPLLEDPGQPWKKAVFTQFPRSYYREGFSVRTERFRYTEWRDKDTRQTIARMLYDLQTDPYEANNIIDSPEYQPLQQKLAKLLDTGWKAALPPGHTNKANNPRGDDSWYLGIKSFEGM